MPMGEKGRRTQRVALVLFYVLVLVIMLLPVWYGTMHGYSVPSADGARLLDASFSIYEDDVFVEESRLPYIVSANGGSSYSLYSKLPDDIRPGEYLLFYTKQTGLEVYIDGEQRYSWVIDDDYVAYPEIRISHTVRLFPEDSGKELEVVYPSSSVILPRLELGGIMIGTASALFHHTFDYYRVMIILIPFFLTLGVFILLVALLSKGNIYAGTIFSFGILVLLLAVGMFSNSILFSLVGNDPVWMSLLYHSCLLLEPFVLFMILHNISRSGSVFRLYGAFHFMAVLFCVYYIVVGFLELFRIVGYDSFDNVFLVLVPVYELALACSAARHRLLGNGRWRYSYYTAIILLAVKNAVGLFVSGMVTYDMHADILIEICSMLSIVLFILEGVFTYFGGHDMIVNVSGYILRSHCDMLSGLMNRRGFGYWCENVLTASGLAYHVAVFDINGMKEINDRYGHMVGDDVLRRLGGVIKSRLSEDDAGFRMGGDEFAVFLIGGEARVISFMSSVGEELSKYGVSVSSAYLPVRPDMDVKAVMADCDRMLYMNKKAFKEGWA